MSVMEQAYKYMQEYLYSNEYTDFLKENNNKKCVFAKI